MVLQYHYIWYLRGTANRIQLYLDEKIILLYNCLSVIIYLPPDFHRLAIIFLHGEENFPSTPCHKFFHTMRMVGCNRNVCYLLQKSVRFMSEWLGGIRLSGLAVGCWNEFSMTYWIASMRICPQCHPELVSGSVRWKGQEWFVGIVNQDSRWDAETSSAWGMKGQKQTAKSPCPPLITPLFCHFAKQLQMDLQNAKSLSIE